MSSVVASAAPTAAASASAAAAGGGGGSGGGSAAASAAGVSVGGGESRRREIYTHEASSLLYALGWSWRQDKPFRLALGTFVEEYANKVDIVQLDEDAGHFVSVGQFDHPYPATKVQWIPDRSGRHPDLLGTTGDYLRLWEVHGGGALAGAGAAAGAAAGAGAGSSSGNVKLKCLLKNNKNSDFCAPLTSFDWNETDPNILGTCSIDTTCTIWNVETQQVRSQLIAHDKEVYDIAFAQGTDIFASVGADGSLRMFDLRNLEHSTIIYETAGLCPLLRVGWNKQDTNYIATFAMDNNKCAIIDVRVPAVPVAELAGHNSCINGLSWAPHSSCHICTAGDDKQALIWDLASLPQPIEDPILAYTAEGEISSLQWSASQTEWIAVCFGNKMQILRV